MLVKQRIEAFVQLGQQLRRARQIGAPAFKTQLRMAESENPWFTQDNISRMLDEIVEHWLAPEVLTSWVESYISPEAKEVEPRRVGVVAAGNIPLVGFHDLMCVLLAGHSLQLKPSSRDTTLMKLVRELLVGVDPRYAYRFDIVDGPLRDIDAIIATGGNSAALHFQKYVEKYPSIMRKHRNAIAIVDGTETPEQIEGLADDIFAYFGLGCRNVSMLLVPEDYDLVPMLDRFIGWRKIVYHHKYANNYEYQRTLLAINGIHHLDTGFVLLRESQVVDSPIGVLHYATYRSEDEVRRFVAQNVNGLQCVVGNTEKYPWAIPFGTAQKPSISDYADGIDTFQFLLDL